MASRRLSFIVFAIFVGFAVGVASTNHVASVMWGDSPYNESAAIWSVDNSGRLRAGDYAEPMLTLAMAFAFMLVSIPIAGMLAASGHSKRSAHGNAIAAAVCFAVFIGGYVWWRFVYAGSMGFPQYHLGVEQIHRGFSTLPKALALVAATSGAVALLSGVIGRIRSS
jgi:hypothetical protein